MDHVVPGLKWKTYLVYLDDVLVYSRTFEEHLENLRAVFTRLRESSLKMKPRKWSFAMEQLRYLGHLFSADGLTVDPRKVEAVRELATPSNRSELRSFLGLASYYRKYIAGHADMVAPLTTMLGENQLFKWGKAKQAAFQAVKECLATAPVLAHPDWDRPFLLQTDASDIALGAALSQEDENGDLRVVYFLSRQLSVAEQKWDTREKEVLAVVWSCEALRPYLTGRQFVLETDHSNLVWLLASNVQRTGRLARWVLRLQEFDFQIRHRPGKANTNADALSRLNRSTQPTVVMMISGAGIPSTEYLRSAQEKDATFGQLIMIKYLKDPRAVHLTPEVDAELKGQGEYSLSTEGLLPHQRIINGRRHCVPVIHASERRAVLEGARDLPCAGHLGRRKTYGRLCQQFYWPGMYADVQTYIKSCLACQQRKSLANHSAGELQLFSTSRPFEMVGIDLIGPFPKSSSGNTYVVTMVDRFTRWPELVAIPGATAETVANAVIDGLVLRHGCPEKILTDRGSQFTSKLFQRMANLKRLGVKKVFTTAYHPQTNGQTKRFNRVIAEALTSFVDDEQRDWDEYLSSLAFAYRSSVVDSISETPYYLVHGRDPKLPTSAIFGSKAQLRHDAQQ